MDEEKMAPWPLLMSYAAYLIWFSLQLLPRIQHIQLPDSDVLGLITMGLVCLVVVREDLKLKARQASTECDNEESATAVI